MHIKRHPCFFQAWGCDCSVRFSQLSDEACSFAIQKGIQISRSDIFWFKHNDMQDLENVLARVGLQRKKQKKPLARQFIVVEGVYANVGDICPLHDLLALKLKYKYRLIVDESHSFGVLGKRGAGICDHFDVKVTFS